MPLHASSAADDETLLRSALRGDEESMHQLVQRLQPVVRASICAKLRKRPRYTRGRSLGAPIDDLVQDVFVSLFARRCQTLRSWRPERGSSLRGFVGLVAERQVGMTLRSRRRNPFYEEATETESLQQLAGAMKAPDATWTALESRDSLRALLVGLHERLSAQGRLVFALLFLQGCTIERTLEMTGLSQAALYAWRSRLTRQARELRAQPSAGAREICSRTSLFSSEQVRTPPARAKESSSKQAGR